MRLTLIGLVGSMALAAAMANVGCSSSNGLPTGTGGTPGAGGSTAAGGTTGSGGGASSCTGLTPCGGSVVGTWTVASSCLSVSGDMDVTLASLGCSTVPVTGALHVTGSWTANADGSYADNTVTTGSITFPLAPKCLSVSSVNVPCANAAGTVQALGWTSVTCSTGSSGQCSCMATVNQNGGLGVVSPWASASGTYTTSGSGLNTDGNVDYSYCASGGSSLTVAPKGTI